MGNCLFGGMGDAGDQSVIRVATSNGGVMEFSAPIKRRAPPRRVVPSAPAFGRGRQRGDGPRRAREVEQRAGAPVGVGALQDVVRQPRADEEVGGGGAAPKAARGFWKVKLVIGPEQLVEILAEEAKTEELIESVRTVAKCGSGLGGFSDQWSLSSSRNAASSNKDVLLEF
ncbi:UNVERIFIED_CONTAM: hypothetical protein Sangu_1705000 [Sesamum angustifolium]|uniref:Uncharacterized protein n=1 Tax=Sesamum angustifolium TaxID=2727405 RepID=A0AAW2MJQ7_9LAMI